MGAVEGKHLIAGIRPEHFEDASLVSDPDAPGATFTTTIDVIEWMGAELFVHFSVEGSAHADLADLAEELETLDLGGGDEAEVVGRLDIHSEAKEGTDLELWVDARQVQAVRRRERRQPHPGSDRSLSPIGAGQGAWPWAMAATSASVRLLEQAAHAVADVGPDGQQHALALVVAGAVLVRLAEVADHDRPVDRARRSGRG